MRPIVVRLYLYEFVAALSLLSFEKVLDFLCVIVEVISLTLVALDFGLEVIFGGIADNCLSFGSECSLALSGDW